MNDQKETIAIFNWLEKGIADGRVEVSAYHVTLSSEKKKSRVIVSVLKDSGWVECSAHTLIDAARLAMASASLDAIPRPADNAPTGDET